MIRNTRTVVVAMRVPAVSALASVVMLVAACAPPTPPGPPGPPTTVTVTTTEDTVDPNDGETSLREAFTEASNDNADTTIVVSSGAEYLLTRCDLGQLRHSGPRPLHVRPDAGDPASITQTCAERRVMYLGGAEVDLEDLVMSGGRVRSPLPCGISIYGQPDCVDGGGILSGADLNLLRVTMTDNRAVQGGGPVRGGALFALGTTTITDSVFSQNYSNRDGGAVFSAGPLTVSGSSFTDNAGWNGAGLSVDGGSLQITDSRFVGNSGGSGAAIRMAHGNLAAADTVFDSNDSNGGPGGAIWADQNVPSIELDRVAIVRNSGRTGALTTFAPIGHYVIRDSTITDNVATTTWRDQYNRAAGGIATMGPVDLRITGSTIAHNSAAPGGGANFDLTPANGSTVTIEDSIVSDPLGGAPNCEPNGNTFTVTGSVATDATCGTAASPSGPALGPLSDLGGSFVRVPAAGSPAIDAYPAPCSTPVDQLGTARPAGAACDIGAYEQ